MWQEFEGQKPAIAYRNLNARTQPNTSFRWTYSPEYSVAWNFQRGALVGLTGGVTAASYLHVREPTVDLLKFYQAPDNLQQLKTYVKEVMKMDTFKRGYLTRLGFEVTKGLTFDTARYGIWTCFNAGFWVCPEGVDIYPMKTHCAAWIAGLASAWIPAVYHNVDIRFRQDQILPEEVSRGYRNHLTALFSILRNDGMAPLLRSMGPLYLEYSALTAFQFSGFFFAYDKLRPLRFYGGGYEQYPDLTLKLISCLFGTLTGCIASKPFHGLRVLVENMPKNSKGERLFNSYSEAMSKFIGEYNHLPQLYEGFGRYLARMGPQMLISLYIAESLGMFEPLRYPNTYLPDEE